MSKIQVKISGEWYSVGPQDLKTEEYTFLHNESLEKMKRQMVENRIDSYARDKVSATWLKIFPESEASPIANSFKDRFAYDLEDNEVYLVDHDGYASDEDGRISLEKYFNRRPELLEVMK